MKSFETFKNDEGHIDLYPLLKNNEKFLKRSKRSIVSIPFENEKIVFKPYTKIV